MSATPVSSEEQSASLIAALRAWGIGYLTADLSLTAESAIPPAQLLQRLARCPQARIRDATIALLLLRPELAEIIPETLATADPETQEQLTTLVLTALYLQRIWLTQLTLALGHPPCFPEAPFAVLWEARQLPPPALAYGEPGLRALEAVEQHRRGVAYCFSGDWHNQVQHLILQQWAAQQRTKDKKLATERPKLQSPWQDFSQEQARFATQYAAAVQRAWPAPPGESNP